MRAHIRTARVICACRAEHDDDCYANSVAARMTIRKRKTTSLPISSQKATEVIVDRACRQKHVEVEEATQFPTLIKKTSLSRSRSCRQIGNTWSQNVFWSRTKCAFTDYFLAKVLVIFPSKAFLNLWHWLNSYIAQSMQST